MDVKKIIEFNLWSELGEDKKIDALSKETTFIKHLPSLGEKYWLHTLYYPLNKRDCGTLMALISHNTEVPITKNGYEELVDFYSQCNGLSLFSNSFSMFGNTTVYDYVHLSEPTPIIKYNNMRTSDVPKEWVAIGYGSLSSNQNAMCYYDMLTHKTCFVELGVPHLKILRAWDSLEQMLKYIYSTLKKNYDKNGYKIETDYDKPLLIRNKTYLQF